MEMLIGVGMGAVVIGFYYLLYIRPKLNRWFNEKIITKLQEHYKACMELDKLLKELKKDIEELKKEKR